MQQQIIYNVGVYCRLSQDDKQNNESISIETQKLILLDYVKKHGYNLIDIYVDDGYSGTNFNRPDFQRLMNDVNNGKINMILTKDLSRLGRDYLQTGLYMQEFSDNGIRYVALNDGYDNLKNEDSDIAPFKNIMNDWYARDISKKVKNAIRQRAASGLWCFGQTPYGYKTLPENKNQLVIDENVKDNVVEMFRLASLGNGAYTIAKIFNEKGVITPSLYKSKNGCTIFNRHNVDSNYWNAATVLSILKNKTYIGNMTYHKEECINHKTKKTIRIKPKDYKVVKNTHEPIIDEETFNKVQILISSRHNTHIKQDIDNIFKSLVYCSECGDRLAFVYNKTKKGKTYYYNCVKYNHDKRIEKHNCSIKFYELKEAITTNLRYVSKLLLDKDKFIKEYFTDEIKLKEKNSYEKEKAKIKSRLNTLNQLIMKIYEDLVNEKLSNVNYNLLLSKYQNEQLSLKEKLDKIESENNQIVDYIQLYQKFRKIFDEVIDFENPAREDICRLINKIIIHPKKVKEKSISQEIEIYYNFIGKID